MKYVKWGQPTKKDIESMTSIFKRLKKEDLDIIANNLISTAVSNRGLTKSERAMLLVLFGSTEDLTNRIM